MGECNETQSCDGGDTQLLGIKGDEEWDPWHVNARGMETPYMTEARCPMSRLSMLTSDISCARKIRMPNGEMICSSG